MRKSLAKSQGGVRNPTPPIPDTLTRGSNFLPENVTAPRQPATEEGLLVATNIAGRERGGRSQSNQLSTKGRFNTICSNLNSTRYCLCGHLLSVTIVNRHRFPLLSMFFSCSFQNVFQYSNIFSSPFTGSIPKLKNMVPAGKKLGTENFEQLFRIAQRYKLGNQTEKMSADKGSDLRKRAKPILTKYATTSEGGYCARSDLGPSRQSDFVYRVAPWLLHYGGRFSF